MSHYTFCEKIYDIDETVHYIDKRNDFSENEILNFLDEQGVEEAAIEQIKATIEDCFIDLMIGGD